MLKKCNSKCGQNVENMWPECVKYVENVTRHVTRNAKHQCGKHVEKFGKYMENIWK